MEGSIAGITSSEEEDAALLVSLGKVASSINNANIHSFRLSDNYRRKLLLKYNNLIKAGVDKSNAAAKMGYTIRAFQRWNSKYNKKWCVQKHTRRRKSHIHHIEGELLLFIQEKMRETRLPLKNSVVREKAKDLCEKFKGMPSKTQHNIITNFMRRARNELPPPRKTTWALTKKKIVLGACKRDNCVLECRRKNNCPHKRMMKMVFKKSKKITCGKLGSGLSIQEHGAKGDFIIEYFGKKVKANAVQDHRGRHRYYMRVDKMIIDGKSKNNMARFINHSCDPNCSLEIKDDEGTPRACIFALKKIRSGSELTIDYNWQRKQNDPFTVCLCGSKKCDGMIEKLVI
jgi:hypothetical protein